MLISPSPLPQALVDVEPDAIVGDGQREPVRAAAAVAPIPDGHGCI